MPSKPPPSSGTPITKAKPSVKLAAISFACWFLGAFFACLYCIYYALTGDDFLQGRVPWLILGVALLGCVFFSVGLLLQAIEDRRAKP